MSTRHIVSGTDTGVGKTVFAAMLTQGLNGIYHKPVQCGLDGETDIETVRRLTGLSDTHFLPEAYRLKTPASPHIAAEIDGVEIDVARLTPPAVDRPLIIEGAGGLLVPLSRRTLYIDVFADWDAQIILCARTTLGTINHTLLSIEALKRRKLPIRGVVFIGDKNKDSERTITEIGEVAHLGRLPILTTTALSGGILAEAFHRNFRHDDFTDPPFTGR